MVGDGSRVLVGRAHPHGQRRGCRGAGGHAPGRDELTHRLVHELHHRLTPDLAVGMSTGLHHDQPSAPRQLGHAGGEEARPVTRRLLGEPPLDLPITTDLGGEVTGNRRRRRAQPVRRDRGPPQRDAARHQDLVREGPAGGERVRVAVGGEVARRVVGDDIEHRREVVVRQVGVHDRDRKVGSLPQRRDCRSHGQHRVLALRAAVVRDHQRHRITTHRHGGGSSAERGKTELGRGCLQHRMSVVETVPAHHGLVRMFVGHLGILAALDPGPSSSACSRRGLLILPSRSAMGSSSACSAGRDT